MTLQIFSFCFPLVLAMALGWFVRQFIKPDPSGGFFAQFIGMSNEAWLRFLSVFLILLSLGSTMLNIMVVFYFKVSDPVIIALVSNFNGVVLGILVMVPGYWLGSSNGSRIAHQDAVNAAATAASDAKS